MIQVNPFTSTDHDVIPINEEVFIEVSYTVTIDSDSEITTTYSPIQGCTIINNNSFDHEVAKGTNSLKDTIKIRASSGACILALNSCKKNTNECSRANVRQRAGLITNNFVSMFDSLNDLKLESTFILTNGSDHVVMNESKAKIHKLLKDKGYAFDKTKKIWKHGKDKK